MSAQKKATAEKKRLVLLDAHAILHRAYHALPDFTSSAGEPTGALYGLCAMLLKIVDELKPDYLIAAYDLPEATFRHDVYDAYKAGRAETDDLLVAQITRSRDLLSAFGIPIYEKAGFEADDILGTIVEKVKGRDDLDVMIASGDMDTLQLVDGKRVRVYTLKKGIKDTIIYDEKAVKERFGFGPALLPDFKGLRGDPSDNIIGIQGIGEKTATELITNFGSIEDIYKKLAKKDSDEAFAKAGIKPRIVNLLREGEEEARFSKELATIRRDAPVEFALPEATWRESLEMARIRDLFQELSFRTLAARVKQLIGDEGGDNGDEETQAKEEQEVEEDIPDERINEVGLALWLLHSDTTTPTRADILAYANTDTFEEAAAKIFRELEGEEKLYALYHDIERPLLPITERMSEVGIRLDRKKLEALSKAYHRDLEAIEARIHDHAGRAFNVNSPRQLGVVLYDELGLKAQHAKKTAGGARSTRESELEKMRADHPIIEDILEYRRLQKLLSSYLDPLPQLLDADDRLHARFEQTGTTTGRMSSHDPNLQNIPIRSEEGRAIREAFVAGEGFRLAGLDYSQIELRVAAFLSGDEKLTEIFISGGDVHASVAAEVFAVPPEAVDHEMRRRAKVINFGILYGMGVNALRAQLGTSRAEAQDFLNEYFAKFHGLARYLEAVRGEARHKGYTETLFGRRRHFEGINSPLPQIKASAERMAINAPIQGTQADIIKKAMVDIDRWIEEKKLRKSVHLLLQVHDELVFEIAEVQADDLVPQIREMMRDVLPLERTGGIPLAVDAEVGENWGAMEKIS